MINSFLRKRTEKEILLTKKNKENLLVSTGGLRCRCCLTAFVFEMPAVRGERLHRRPIGQKAKLN